MPWLIPLIVGAVGSIAGAAIGGSAASKAAQTQSDAAVQAAQIQADQANKGLNFQENVYGQQMQNIQPFLETGTGANVNLANLMGVLPPNPVAQGFWPTLGQYAQSAPGAGPAGNNINMSSLANPGTSTFSTLPGRATAPGNNMGPSFSAAPGQRFAPNAGTNTSRALPVPSTLGGPANMNPPTGINANLRLPPPGTVVPTQTDAQRNAQFAQFAKDNPSMFGPQYMGNAPGAPGATTSTGAQPNVALQSLINPQLGATGSLAQGWNTPFVAPTGATEQNDPGYKFRLQQGLDALQNSAAARGGLLSGGTGKALEGYAQDYASNEYGNVYGRSLGQYQQNYNIFQNNQANLYNRLASMAGMGQVATGQLGTAGQSAAGNVGSILLGSGQQIGQAVQNAAAARASGYVGQANALAGGIGGVTGDLSQMIMLKQLLAAQQGSGNQSGSAYPS